MYPVANVPSCITYYDDSLWIATHNKYTDSVMMRYVYDADTDRLRNMDDYRIPPKVQGLVFDTDGSLYVSSSYGRRSSSYLRKYSSVYTMSQDTADYELLVEMPPCSEGIALSKDALYVLFESANGKYYTGSDGYGKSLSPLDKILIIHLGRR